MKALVISMLILLMSFFNIIPAFGQPVESNSVPSAIQNPVASAPEAAVTESDNKKPADADAAVDANKVTDANTAADANVSADANLITDVNAAADPNVVRAEIEKFEGLSQALEQIASGSGKEMEEWVRGKLDDRLDLALEMQKQIKAELKFLRKLAVKEGAAETTAAIDGILLDRQERFKSVIVKLTEDNERLRRIRERQERNRESNGRERTIRERPERPDRTRKDVQQ